MAWKRMDQVAHRTLWPRSVTAFSYHKPRSLPVSPKYTRSRIKLWEGRLGFLPRGTAHSEVQCAIGATQARILGDSPMPSAQPEVTTRTF